MYEGEEMRIGLPPEPPPIVKAILFVIGLPLVFCGIHALPFFGFVAMMGAICAASTAPWAAFCIAIVLALYFYMWADEVGLLPLIGVLVAFLSLMGAIYALFSGIPAGVFGVCFSLVTFVSSRNAMKKTTQPVDLVGLYAYLVLGTCFLGLMCLVITEWFFGLEVSLLEWRIVVTGNFPFVELRCGCHAH